MRFIGNKENLLTHIYHVMQSKNITGTSIFDCFCGTVSVGKFFKQLGYQVISSDLLYFSFALQKAYIENNQEPMFKKLLTTCHIKNNALFETPLIQVVNYLNNLPLSEGFIFQNYTPEGTKYLAQPRMYFSNENGKKIDSIRKQIEEWKITNIINDLEYFILLTCLIESVPFYANITGTYAAFQKQWDSRALKKFQLRSIEPILNEKENYVFNNNSVDLLNKIEADIFYLDPPYNQRQYAANYHLLETITKYDNPEITGISGLRNYKHQKSLFCNTKTALQELYKIAKNGKYKVLILSYNTEGIMPQYDILSILNQFGKVEIVEFDHLRFKSNNNGDSKYKKYIQEQLYILQR